MKCVLWQYILLKYITLLSGIFVHNFRASILLCYNFRSFNENVDIAVSFIVFQFYSTCTCLSLLYILNFDLLISIIFFSDPSQ
jgi:hypothetical protein